jgi:hypothetical protein
VIKTNTLQPWYLMMMATLRKTVRTGWNPPHTINIRDTKKIKII